MQTRTRSARVPDDLYLLAMQRLDVAADASSCLVIRAALAYAAGVDVADYTPRRTGRPQGAKDRRPRTRQQAGDGERAA